MKNIIIGFLMATCMFLFMGFHSEPQYETINPGGYQLVEFTFGMDSDNEQEGFVIFDTRTGKCVSWVTSISVGRRLKQLNREMGFTD